MIVDLEEIKNVMKVDNNDDDKTIETLLNANISLVKSILRVNDFKEFSAKDKALIKSAIYYATTYRYEFINNADMKLLEFNVRSILNTLREVKF